MNLQRILAILLLFFLVSAPACSVRRYAINKVGDALASGGSTYESDDDIELVGQALPFGLKLIESLLAESPRHKGLLLAACRGFATYSYVYVRQEADVVAEHDFVRAKAMRARARKLYLRAFSYCQRALEASHPGVAERLWAEPQAALSTIKKKDVPIPYWNAVSLGLAISVSQDDAGMLARLSEVEALVERALDLDESWKEGTLQELQIILAGARPGRPDFELIKNHFERAQMLSQGRRAGLYVAYAEAVAVPRQDRTQFQFLLEKALAINVDEYKEVRLANLVAQRRARRLLAQIDDLILMPELTAQEGGE